MGAVIGAGFISGQELAQFFLRFGLHGLFAWIIVCIVSITGGYYGIASITQRKIQSFNELTRQIFDPKLAKLANIVSLGYLVGGLIIMISGSGTLISSLVGANIYTGIFVISAAIFVNTIGKEGRLLTVNKILIPLLLILTIYVSLTLIRASHVRLPSKYEILNPSPLIPNWWSALPLYIGYNAIGALVAMINIAHSANTITIKKGGLIGGLLISAMGFLLLFVLAYTYPIWKNSELPIVDVIRTHYSELYIFFAPGMLIAMYTVAVHYTLGISKFVVSISKIGSNIVTLCVLALVIPLSSFGFSKLVGTIYPIFGIMATLLIMWGLIHLFIKKSRVLLKKIPAT